MVTTAGMTGNELVDQITKISISGNVIPDPWYKTIVRSTGKPNLVAIIILADIVYWYRAKEVHDETGKVIGYKKKFKGDLLQRSYQQLADKFGFSKRQVTCAVIDLEELNIIERVFKTVSYGNVLMSNVLYIRINPKKVMEISCLDCHCPESMASAPLKRRYPLPEKRDTLSHKKETPSPLKKRHPLSEKRDTLSPKKETPSPLIKGHPLSEKRDTLSLKNETPSPPKKGHPLPKNGETYTETTTETTTEIIKSSSSSDIEKIKEHINYDKIVFEEEEIKPILDDIVRLIADVLDSSENTMGINKTNIPVEKIKVKFRELNEERVLSVIEALRCNVDADIRISNLRGWLLTSLYNAASNCSYMTLKSNKSKKCNTNKFNNFNQRKYDYEELERRLLEKNNNNRELNSEVKWN